MTKEQKNNIDKDVAAILPAATKILSTSVLPDIEEFKQALFDKVFLAAIASLLTGRPVTMTAETLLEEDGVLQGFKIGAECYDAFKDRSPSEVMSAIFETVSSFEINKSQFSKLDSFLQMLSKDLQEKLKDDENMDAA